MDKQSIVDLGIIEPKELNALLVQDDLGVKILDASFYLPTSDQDSHQNYLHEHIEGAAYFDIKGIADKTSDLPHMIPSEEDFARAIAALGISNDDLVVIYGQTGMLMGPARAWWMMRVFGHDNVCVLNGGLPAWKADGLAVAKGIPLDVEPAVFKAQLQPDLVRNMDDVLSGIESSNIQILDARPRERYTGEAKEPRAGMRSGRIPGSISLPCSSLVDSNTGKFKPKEDMIEVLRSNGFEQNKAIIASCGSGITACALALALYYTGNKGAAVYDGSWSEWGKEEAGTPVENG